MMEAVLIDMFSIEFNTHFRHINQFLAKAMKLVAEKTVVSSDPAVYIMYCQTFGCDSNDAREMFLRAIRSFQALKKRIELVSGASVAATLYNVKQKLDERNVRRVNVILPFERSCLMKAFIDRLFTQVYYFEYDSLDLSYGDDQTEKPANTHSGVLNLTEKQLELVESDIQIYLQSIPAKGELTILKSSLIPESVFLHGFTTRYGGISYIPLLSSLNLYSSDKRHDSTAVVAENLRRLARAVGFNPKNFHLVKAAHANDVWIMGKKEPDSYDGIVTNQKGVTIAAPGADCIPLLFSDPVKKVFGAAHSGWRGTLMGVAMATVNAMVSEYGCSMKDIQVVLGPSVGPCCFTLPQQDAKAFHDIHPQCVRQIESPSPHVDIRRATKILLDHGGILPSNIQDDLMLCTCCNPDLFFSHKRDGDTFGTQIGFISTRN
ncbi:purine nucleoside phosphorylase LACC1-like [Pelobates fuscus]|uniref:purine nucleoside phosphorylase LACC1-like n=1 Tax=Pelobates fuscus TaxID=191477 RepID=UPI002FE490DD